MDELTGPMDWSSKYYEWLALTERRPAATVDNDRICNAPGLLEYWIEFTFSHSRCLHYRREMPTAE